MEKQNYSYLAIWKYVHRVWTKYQYNDISENSQYIKIYKDVYENY